MSTAVAEAVGAADTAAEATAVLAAATPVLPLPEDAPAATAPAPGGAVGVADTAEHAPTATSEKSENPCFTRGRIPRGGVSRRSPVTAGDREVLSRPEAARVRQKVTRHSPWVASPPSFSLLLVPVGVQYSQVTTCLSSA